MKNLFDFATKELSQDAFLRWLFENYKEDDLKETCKVLFKKFTNDELTFENVTNLTTEAQWKKIDVTINFTIGEEKYFIAIEDKTSSKEHNQLEKYNDEISKLNYKPSNVYKIFYKTNLMDKDEINNIKNKGWKVFNIEDIYNMFPKNKRKGNLILNNYIDHISNVYDMARRTVGGKSIPPSQWSLIGWNSFFNEYDSICGIKKTNVDHYQRSYYYMKLAIEGCEKTLPLLEIRGFDKNKDIIIKCVFYDMEFRPSEQQIYSWLEKLKEKGFYKKKKFNPITVQELCTYDGVVTEDDEIAIKELINKVSTIFKEIFSNEFIKVR